MEQYPYEEQEGGSSEGIIIVVLVIVFVVIGALVYYYYFYNPTGGPTTSGNFQWTIKSSTATTSDTWLAAAGQAYQMNPAATGNFILTLTAPTTALGQEFLIINQSKASIRVNAPGITYVVNNNSNSSAIWMSQTVVNVLY